MNRNIHVYEINDCEWVAAASPLEAAVGYASEVGHSLDRVVQDELIDVKGGCPRQLTAREMRELKFHDNDGVCPVERSFRAQLERMIKAGATFPAYFATTEY